MNEYFEGHRIIEHDDGSTTHITYEHEPYSEPLTPKQSLAILGITAGIVAATIGFPFVIEKWVDRTIGNSERRERQRLNKEIFDQIPA